MGEVKFTKKMEAGKPAGNYPFGVDGFCNLDGERFEACAVWGVDKDKVPCEQSRANSYLFAAAPEMYEEIEREYSALLWEIQNLICDDESDEKKMRKLQVSAYRKANILAKARGEL